MIQRLAFKTNVDRPIGESEEYIHLRRALQHLRMAQARYFGRRRNSHSSRGSFRWAFRHPIYVVTCSREIHLGKGEAQNSYSSAYSVLADYLHDEPGHKTLSFGIMIILQSADTRRTCFRRKSPGVRIILLFQCKGRPVEVLGDR
jgi:hypothetical protein